jgi:predicted DNA-binding ribbon-helix-helix protein
MPRAGVFFRAGLAYNEAAGCCYGVQGELGARAIMNETEHAAPTVASPKPKHSVVVSWHKTSVSLEEPFWQALREIATARGLTVRALISLVDEKREQGNLSSALHVFALEHFRAICQKETKACATIPRPRPRGTPRRPPEHWAEALPASKTPTRARVPGSDRRL